MEAVDGESPAPPDLRLGWECERFSCLPEAGGYLDQKYMRVSQMAALMNVYGAYAHYRNAHGTDIHNLSESERRILRQLKDMKLIFQ